MAGLHPNNVSRSACQARVLLLSAGMTRAFFLGAGVLGAVLAGSGMRDPTPNASRPAGAPSPDIRLRAGRLGRRASPRHPRGRRPPLPHAPDRDDPSSGTGRPVLPTPFLDISAQIVCCGEQGLLSTAFHPDYANNGFFFVNYTDSRRRHRRSRGTTVSPTDPNRRRSRSARRSLLTIDQPFANHNGGQLQFGPDGYLYIGMGDGGSANDPAVLRAANGAAAATTARQAPAHRREPERRTRRRTTGSRRTTRSSAPGGPRRGLGQRPAQPLAVLLRPADGRSLHRRRRTGRARRDRLPAAPSAGGENYGWKMMEGTRCAGNDGNCRVRSAGLPLAAPATRCRSSSTTTAAAAAP